MSEITVGKAIEWGKDDEFVPPVTDSLLEALASVGSSTLPVPMIDKVNYFPKNLSILEEAASRLHEDEQDRLRRQS